MRRRRIFRPAAHPRRWGMLAVVCGLVLGATALAMVLPRNPFGSAASEQDWTATAPDVRVLDGETLRLGDRVLRLAGLVVPDRGQAGCPDRGAQRTDCAAAAADALARLVQGRDLACRVRGHDRQGRALGTCRAGGVELNAALVAAGWALADTASRGLLPMETTAREAGRGLWAAGATPRESWRGKP